MGIETRKPLPKPGREKTPDPFSCPYKDVADVVETMDVAGISKRVARFRPVGVIKG